MPLDFSTHIVALARSVVLGGASGLRIQGETNIAAVRSTTDLPIIGLIKVSRPGTEVYITPTVGDIQAAVAAGADIIAFDATLRPRPDTVQALCAATRQAGRLSMADISTAEEGARAMAAGADIVSTTMAGYTQHSRGSREPDFRLMSELAALGVPFAAEGRIWTGEDARRCLDLGAAFVVVGSAITRPDTITRRFIDATIGTTSQKPLRSAAQ